MRLKKIEQLEDKNKKYQLVKNIRKAKNPVFMLLERENPKINKK